MAAFRIQIVVVIFMLSHGIESMSATVRIYFWGQLVDHIALFFLTISDHLVQKMDRVRPKN